MAEDASGEYKKDSAITNFPDRASLTDIGTRRRLIRRRFRRIPDYSEFKASMETAVEEIKVEIRSQHEQTRAEVQTVRRDVLEAVKASPAEYMKLVCEFGSLFMLFALAIRFTLRIELVNTAFALFMLLAFGVYWAMARKKQQSDAKRSNSPAA